MALDPELEDIRSELMSRSVVFLAQGRPLTAAAMASLAHRVEMHRCDNEDGVIVLRKVDPNARCCGIPLDERGRCQHRPHHRTPYYDPEKSEPSDG